MFYLNVIRITDTISLVPFKDILLTYLCIALLTNQEITKIGHESEDEPG